MISMAWQSTAETTSIPWYGLPNIWAL